MKILIGFIVIVWLCVSIGCISLNIAIEKAGGIEEIVVNSGKKIKDIAERIEEE